MTVTWRTAALPLTVTLLVVAIDLVLGTDVALTPVLVLGPLLAAATTGWRGAALVGAVAVAIAVALGPPNEYTATTRHVISVATVLGGAMLCTLLAALREAERRARLASERARVRADLLARAGELFESGGDPLDRLDAIAALPVPALADLVVIDLIGADDRLRAAAIASADPAYEGDIRRIRDAHGVPPGSEHPVARVARSGQPLLLRRIRDEDMAGWAASAEHLALMRRIAYRTGIVVPLTARGRTIGALSLIRMRGALYSESDLDTARDLARRAGLAIDHARLGAELGETESELRTVLQALTEAVTVQGADGRVVYANEAAARLDGHASVEALLATHAAMPGERWIVRDERGAPVPAERFPAAQALAGVAEPEPLLLQILDRETGERRWRLTKASPVLGPDGRPRLTVNVTEDVTDQRQREFSQAFLAQASKLLSASLDPAETLEKIARAAVPDLADWCAVDMPDERGVLRRVATADRSPERLRIAELVLGERDAATLSVGPPEVMRTGVSQLHPVIDDALLRAAARDERQLEQLRAVGARSALSVPMVATSGVTGTITLGTIESGRRLTDDDLALAEELGRRAGIALEHSREHGERSAIAATLQAALLPPPLPSIPDLAIAARFRAAGGVDTVGGDFYDLFPVAGEPSSWLVVMGDVTGTGPAAAAITAVARYAARTASLYEREPSAVLARLNDVLVQDGERRRVCTAVCVLVEARPGAATITVACAGHPPPLRVDAAGVTEPVGTAGTLLGAFPDGSWTDTTLTLATGETLLLYTDGVTDTRGPEGRFGGRRLRAFVAGCAGRPVEEVAAALDAELLAFQRGPQRDDVALLLLQPS